MFWNMLSDGYRPLMIASIFSRKEIIKLLLKHGADVNARTNDG
ncbi:MAG: ankyrin repeat domain-containing protein, partial [Campylobacter sp.]|nr:ankyrin repeat domain-containing protein [Campylobacter sp.]